MIPFRCKNCVHWLGHLSGNPKDTRCNRNYGHEEKWGHFYDESMADQIHGHPARVEAECTVPKWGIPIPELDDNGNATGLPYLKPVTVDAFLPIKNFDNEESIRILLATPYGTPYVDSKELREYLMATDKEKQALIETLLGRDASRNVIKQRHYDAYNKRYGTTPRVLHGAKSLPPYQRGLEKVPTKIAQLDKALKGGVPVGCRMNVSGRPDSGKSTFVNLLEGSFLNYYREKVGEFMAELGADEETIAAAKANERIGLIKPESFELQYMMRAMNLSDDPAEREAIFNEGFEFIATDFSEESTQFVVSVLREDNKEIEPKKGPDVYSYMLPISYRLFTLDSVDAQELADEAYGAKGVEKVMGDNARIGAQARLLAEFFRKSYKAASIPITLVLVSQHRTTNIQTRATTSAHRGKAHPYFTTLEFNMFMPKADPSDVTIPVTIAFGKVHVDANVKKGDEITLYLRPGEGFTVRDNAVAQAIEDGIVKKSGAWIRYVDLKGEEHKHHGTNPGAVADWLAQLGLIDEIYNRVMNNVIAEEFIEEEPELETDETE